MALATNSTISVPESFLDVANRKMSSYGPELEFAWAILIISPFLVNPWTFKYTSPKVARARNYPHLPLLVHIFTSVMIVLRYHARFAALRVRPRPDSVDLVLFSVFILSSFVVEAHRSAKQVPTVRSGFQAGILIQAMAFAASWAKGGDPALFRAAVKYFNWFGSFRTTSALLGSGSIDPRLAGMKNFALRYEVVMLVSGSFAVWEAGVPAGVPMFFGVAAALMILERAVADVLSR